MTQFIAANRDVVLEEPEAVRTVLGMLNEVFKPLTIMASSGSDQKPSNRTNTKLD